MESVIAEYRRLAADYDQRFVDYNARTINATAEKLKDLNGKQLVDIGCGTGILLRLLSQHFPGASLTGVDIVDKMLHVARQKLPDQIELIEASACHLPLQANSADIVITTNAFHYFPDQTLAVQEMMRVLKPGGQLVITDWNRDFFSNKLMDCYLRAIGKGHYHMLNAADLNRILTDLGAEDIRMDVFKIDWLWGMMTASAYKPSH